MGESSCKSNSSYEIGLNERCYNDGVVDSFFEFDAHKLLLRTLGVMVKV